MSLFLALIALSTALACHRGPVDEAGPGALTFTSGRPPFPWSVAVTRVSPGLAVDPGKTWSLSYDLEVDLRRHRERYGTFTHLVLAAQGLLRHDAAGHFRPGVSSAAVSANFTTTGLPVERFDGWPELTLLHGKNGSPFEGVRTFALPRDDLDRRHRFKGTLAVKLPAKMPRGHYQVRLMVFARVEGVADPVLLENYGDNSNTQDRKVLPLVAVGKPATPRLPWTLFSPLRGTGTRGAFYRGQPGVLPREDRGKVEMCGRSGFPRELILPSGHYDVSPSFPTLFPVAAMPPVSGGLEVFPVEEPNYLRFDRGEVSCSIEGPGISRQHLGVRRIVGKGSTGPLLQGDSFPLNMTRTGTYTVRLSGHIEDAYRRRFWGGGTYQVHVARPLSFSTSCKPGTSFLVGDGYPAKVNVNPPFPATVQVKVMYLPGSDVRRRRTWVARGKANRFGHYVPSGPPPWRFDEPGEYRSEVTATFRDGQGVLWMGNQTSGGVIAPREPGTLRLHGTRSFPFDYKVERPFYGGVRRFDGRKPLTLAFLPFRPSPLPDVFAAHDPRDTLFVSSSGFNENLVEPHLSMAISDPDLSRRVQLGNRMASAAPPPLLQPRKARWLYLKDVVQVSADSAAWFPADRAHADELPVRSVGGKFHPYASPGQARIRAYMYMGVVRPGFPVMTSVLESEALGLYWLASPNPFGRHLGAGRNGDLPGDLYRIQAGAVLLDRRTGKRYYDAYSAAIAVVPNDGRATAIVAPGRRPLVKTADREHRIFLATDTHDALDAGERMGFGGMVFPAVRADVSWTVTRPSGEQVRIRGKANRLGIVRGRPVITADRPGVYRVKVRVKHGDLTGDVVGTRDGSYWHCVLPGKDLSLLETTLGTTNRIHPRKGLRVPLTWPGRLEDVKLHYSVLMPGQVLDQGIIRGAGGAWTYHFDPTQMSVQFPNLDARDYNSGRWRLADTVVFQFFLEGKDRGQEVFDSVRLVLRGQRLFNYEALIKIGASGDAGGEGGHPGPHPEPKQ